MSRSRNIKPGFFRNELLVELPFEYRLLFIGIWTLADREGRLEDRPVKIRMELFPADNVDVGAGLQALHDKGFILRYTADGKAYVQVLTWCKHQNPHVKEAASTIPAPDLPEFQQTSQEAKAPGEHGASTGQAPDMHDADPLRESGKPETSTVRAGLIPDSSLLIPDSRFPSTTRGRVYSPEFLAAWNAKPDREGGDDKARAAENFSAAVQAGHDPETILAGVKRYASYCAATDRAGTQYAMKLANFVSLKHDPPYWTQDWKHTGEQASAVQAQLNRGSAAGNPNEQRDYTRIPEDFWRGVPPAGEDAAGHPRADAG